MISTLRKRLRKEEKGFTLIELLVVIIILGILTAIAIPSYLSFTGRAHDSAAKANLRALIPDVEAYFSDQGAYTGMTIAGLKTAYDQSLDSTIYEVVSVGTNTYCVSAKSSPTSTVKYFKAGPAAQMSTTPCT